MCPFITAYVGNTDKNLILKLLFIHGSTSSTPRLSVCWRGRQRTALLLPHSVMSDRRGATLYSCSRSLATTKRRDKNVEVCRHIFYCYHTKYQGNKHAYIYLLIALVKVRKKQSSVLDSILILVQCHLNVTTLQVL